ncbi:MAG: hypothetical protein GXP61_00640 [Epsilonproteobacteria bacterium]|nr:hypothetical protein [Campylobacterota bacterium]
MSWINSLKIAIIEDDIKSISKLTNNLPNFTILDEAQEALSLIKVATDIVNKKREETLNTINKIKQTKNFLSS